MENLFTERFSASLLLSQAKELLPLSEINHNDLLTFNSSEPLVSSIQTLAFALTGLLFSVPAESVSSASDPKIHNVVYESERFFFRKFLEREESKERFSVLTPSVESWIKQHRLEIRFHPTCHSIVFEPNQPFFRNSPPLPQHDFDARSSDALTNDLSADQPPIHVTSPRHPAHGELLADALVRVTLALGRTFLSRSSWRAPDTVPLPLMRLVVDLVVCALRLHLKRAHIPHVCKGGGKRRKRSW